MPGILYKDLKLCRGTFIGQAIMLIITNSLVLIPYLTDRNVYGDSTDGSDPLLGMMCIFTGNTGCRGMYTWCLSLYIPFSS